MGSRATPGDAAESLQAGRAGRPHGLDGSFYVTGARPRLLTIGTGVTVAGHTAAIVRRAGTEQRPIVRLEGIEDRLGAEALRGMTLTVSSGQAPALAEDEWWTHELEGLAVLDGEELLGTVARVIELPSCEALEVQPAPGGAPLLVPMVKDAIRRVGVSDGRIEINLDFIQPPEPPGRESPGRRSESS